MTELKYDEEDNVCNLPQIAEINLYLSETTGRYYVERITWCGDPEDGDWIDSPLTAQQVKEIMAICGVEFRLGDPAAVG